MSSLTFIGHTKVGVGHTFLLLLLFVDCPAGQAEGCPAPSLLSSFIFFYDGPDWTYSSFGAARYLTEKK